MLIRGARVHSFRSLENVDVPIGPVTVLIGRNGAGKTSVLEALGHLPSLEGETARPHDDRAQMSWYVAHADVDVMTSRLLSQLPHGPDASAFIDRFGDYLVIRYRGDIHRTAVPDAPGADDFAKAADRNLVWALDRFRAFVDHGELERHRFRNDLEEMLTDCESEVIASALGRLRAIDPSDRNTAFVDFPELPTPPADLAAEPNIVSMFAAPTDVSPLLLRWSKGIAAAYFSGASSDVDQALDRLEAGEFIPLDQLGLLRPVLDTWAGLANEIAPSFLRRSGRIELAAVEGPDNDVGRLFGAVQHILAGDSTATAEALRILDEQAAAVDMHLEVLYVEAGSGGTPPFRYSRLGTGHRRWISATIDEAARLLIESSPDVVTGTDIELARRSGRLGQPRLKRSRAPRVRLIDEPVDSIESRIHGEVVSWLRGRVHEREHLVMSTHQPSILQAGSQAGEVVVVGLKKPERTASTVLFGPRLLEEFRSHLDDLGIAVSELMFLASGLLLVEGKDDARVITTLYEDELAARGFFVHGVGGSTSSNIVSAFQHSAYELLDIPTWVMLDRTVDDRVPAGLRFSLPTTLDTEVAKAQEVVPRLRPLPFGAPDIAFGIRPEVYGAALTHHPPLEGTEYIRWLKATDASAAKSIVSSYRRGLVDGRSPEFSKHILDPVLQYIKQEHLGPTAASPWLASSMERLFEDFDGARERAPHEEELR